MPLLYVYNNQTDNRLFKKNMPFECVCVLGIRRLEEVLNTSVLTGFEAANYLG